MRFNTFESKLIFFGITSCVQRSLHAKQKSAVFYGVMSQIKEICPSWKQLWRSFPEWVTYWFCVQVANFGAKVNFLVPTSTNYEFLRCINFSCSDGEQSRTRQIADQKSNWLSLQNRFQLCQRDCDWRDYRNHIGQVSFKNFCVAIFLPI